VSRNIGIVLSLAVESCTRLCAELKDSKYTDANKQQKLAELKMRTKSALIYAGMIQFRLPVGVYQFLHSREVE
jgi:nuclear pore complex protein Nup93